MRASENTIYLSDYFTVPMPQKASSHQDYLKKNQKPQDPLGAAALSL